MFLLSAILNAKQTDDLTVSTQTKKLTNKRITSIKKFREESQKIIFNPIIQNQNIYDVKVIDLKTMSDKVLEKYDRITYRVKNGKLPFILNIKISLKQNYYNSVKKFIENNSIKCNDKDTSLDFIQNKHTFYLLKGFNNTIENKCRLSNLFFKILTSIYDKNRGCCDIKIKKDVYIYFYDNNNNLYAQQNLSKTKIDYNNDYAIYDTIYNKQGISYGTNIAKIDPYQAIINNKSTNWNFVFGWEEPVKVKYVFYLTTQEAKKLDHIKIKIQPTK